MDDIHRGWLARLVLDRLPQIVGYGWRQRVQHEARPDWFLADMLLFFVPAVLAALDHREFLGLLGLEILVIILISTALVMAATAFTIDLILRWSDNNERLAS